VRTTLTLDPDVAAELERRRRQHNRSLKEEVNHLLRLGLLHADDERRAGASSFRTQPASVGRLLIGDLDDVADALQRAEGDAHR
jgi:hypothetical protein